MSPRVYEIDHQAAKCLIFNSFDHIVEDKKLMLLRAVIASENIFLGYDKRKLLCMYGVIPPTLMSDEVYLWLHVTPEMKGHSFTFIRHSQMARDRVLALYRRIIGQVVIGPGHDRTMAWLRMLGAKFGECRDGETIPFYIERANG